ncbi:hypothetical protein EJF36_13945 [Bacillus sp. HMF5848]|uniref:hypothetical protein n=1 Tax=Bacillus sp. HMF5848 TaxID=2495421 RepID=UPI000F77C011|nr:hypothetical protein [Bacillus sp. HMF5848]RSK27892.1 hypothetical protein EJF36_13945 [Bacillus sp. HMF5848]
MLNNIFFVVIVLAGLFNFFKAKNQTQQQRPVRRVPAESYEPINTPVDMEIDEPFDFNLTKYQDITKAEAPKVVEKPKPEKYRRHEKTITKRIEKPATKRGVNFSKDNVVEGVVWAEILGPPRSKKPYNR